MSYKSFVSVPTGFLLIFAITGCGEQSRHIDSMSKKTWQPETAKWPELIALMRPDDPADPSLEKVMKSRGNNAKAIVGHQKFQDAIKKFEETPIPSKSATPEREASKKALVEALKKLTEVAQKGTPADVMKQTQEATNHYVKILEIPGQTPPQGEAAKKFAPTYTPTAEEKAKAGKRRE